MEEELEEKESVEITDEELIELMWSRFRPMNQEEQEALLKVLLLNYYHYITHLSKKDDQLLRGAYSECSFVINYLTYPAEALREQGYDPRRLIIKNAVKDFNTKFLKKADA